MTSDSELRNLLQLLREPTLSTLAEDSVRDYVDWDQLASRPLPPGLDIEETWELLGLIRRFGATTFPIPTLDARTFWYNTPSESTRCLHYIKHHCRTGSALHRTIQQRAGQRFLIRSRIQEAVATCQLDGVNVTYSSAGRALREGRAPRTPAERLVLNSYQMLRELDSGTPEPFTPDLVRGLYERVTHGVDVSQIARGPRRSNLAGTLSPDQVRGHGQERDILQEICDYANGITGDPSEPSAIKSYLILSAMGYWRPLPDFNETVGRHMLRLFALRRDYPVLGYLSTSLTMTKWFDGSLRPGVVRFATLERRPVVAGSIDGTQDVLTHLQLTTAAIGGLIGYIARTKREDAALQVALDSQELLNYRQRSVLARALAKPDTEFRIRSHQTSHRVVYQTARTDLLTLVDHGYLRKETRGKAFVFVPTSDLPERLRCREDVAKSEGDQATGEPRPRQVQ